MQQFDESLYTGMCQKYFAKNLSFKIYFFISSLFFTGYPTYNNWVGSKVPSAPSLAKGFGAWGLNSPLAASAMAHHHNQVTSSSAFCRYFFVHTVMTFQSFNMNCMAAAAATSSVTSSTPSSVTSPHSLTSYGNGHYAAAGAAMYAATAAAAVAAKDTYTSMTGECQLFEDQNIHHSKKFDFTGFGVASNNSLRLKPSPSGKDRDTPTGYI